MMSAQFSSMLEHLRLGPFIKAVRPPTSNNNSSPEEDTSAKCTIVLQTSESPTMNGTNGYNGTTSSSGDEVDHINVVVTDEDDDAKHVGNRRVLQVSSEVTFDPKKRFSIPAGVIGSDANGGGDIGRPKANRELVPNSPRNMQRKMSQDLRFRGSNCQLIDDGGYEAARIRRPVKLKSILSEYETYDSLHAKAMEAPNTQLACSRTVCMGSVMSGGNFPNASNEPRKPDVLLEHAKHFLDQYYTSIRSPADEVPNSVAFETRLRQIAHDIETTKSYHLTETELIYGAKLAWRNSARCIGRIQWSKLQVFDCRYVTTTSGMFEALCNHIKYATNKGNLRSAITIFPQRTDGKHDYRIWNPQLISYAGYRQPDGGVIGDPQNAEFTEVCVKLGWKSKRTPWDILPLVLSANGHDPDYFDLPAELVLEVQLTHPTYEWFADLKLRWYAVPAVTGMSFDCGGIQFTATAFSGWYMSTEIGCRNLCDTNRRNMLETVALKMKLDTRTSTSLWKDRALVEINLAVLHSFQSSNVTIVDHHTASESFMKHMENETKLRNGCPADWVWIVPPMSSSITPVYHQEMVLYHLKPSFDYQEAAYKTHVWKKDRDISKSRKPRRKFNFKQIARAVKFTSKLFGRALSRRIKATVLYATETGKSEQYAKQLVTLFGHAFNAQVYCMTDYDISSIEHEALLIVIASTFGNGDPPENGEEFAQGLHAMKLRESGESNEENPDTDNVVVSSKSFMKANSRNDFSKLPQKQQQHILNQHTTRDSITTETYTEEMFGPLSNVRFAVFALGSSAYPNFCAYGKYVDNALGDLGGERLVKVSYGDEMCGQEHAFRKWAPEVFKIACDTFCLDTDQSMKNASLSLKSETFTVDNVRMVNVVERDPIDQKLSRYHNKKAIRGTLRTNSKNLHIHSNGNTERSTILVEIQANDVDYEPGDHIGIFPENNTLLVSGILEKLVGVENFDDMVQIQTLKETHSTNGPTKSWEPHERLPSCSVRTLLTRFVDITTPPSRQLLTFLAGYCENKEDEEKLTVLANETSTYEDWKHYRLPHLLEVLEEFPSCRPPASLLVLQLMPLQARFYSISSSPQMCPNQVHLTVAVVKYRTEDGEGPWHYGVCSNYLEQLGSGDEVFFFMRSASGFHLPKDNTKPIILIGPGTGIAPFRSFWQHWQHQRSQDPDFTIPRVSLFFGCRTTSLDLYSAEKQLLIENGILDKVYLALSREKDVPKTYVQDLVDKVADSVYDHIVKDEGHIYVCGDVTMAEHVYQTLRGIIMRKESSSEADVEKFLLTLRDQNRYHEDIFGITLRTAEIHNKSRANARIRMASQPQSE